MCVSLKINYVTLKIIRCINLTKLILDIYEDFGFSNVKINYADRPQKRVGDDKIWDKSEEALLKAIKKMK